MQRIATILIGLIAALHLCIAWFEMFAWTTLGPKVFASFPTELFEPTSVLMANQGLYNSFLAAGLIWSLFIKDREWRFKVAMCFLMFVAFAGIFGAATASALILFVQAVPAALAMIFAWLGYRQAER